MKRAFFAIIAGCLLLPALPAAAATTRTVCASGCDYPTIAAAVTASVAGDTIEVQGDLSVAAATLINKPLTVTSTTGAKITRTGTSSAMFTISGAADGTIISNLEMTTATVVGGTFITLQSGANDITLQGNTIYGQQPPGPMSTWPSSRAWVNPNVTGLSILDNTLHTMRAGGIMDGGSGVVSGNTTYNTKGDFHLADQANFQVVDNSAGDPDLPSEWGVVIYAVNNTPYDVQAMGAANDCLTIWDQFTNETYIDSDCDGVPDPDDDFDDDPTETTDTDGDGVGDNADEFDDDPTETTDTDGDGVGDNADDFPNDPDETTNSDTDTIGDNADNCDTVDNEDQADLDADGEGDACDADRDGDGIPNEDDAFPDTLNDADNDGVEDTDAPTSADQCKKNGWAAFNNPTFKNQGACVSYVNTNK